MKNSEPSLWKYAGAAGAIGMNLVVSILLGYFGGSYISRQTGHQGWVVGGVLAGLFVGLASIVLLVRRFLEDMNE